MDALVEPVPTADAASWSAALEEAKSKLARLAVRRAGAVRFRVTDHEVRTAFSPVTADNDAAAPFAWSALTARRSIGVAAVRLLLAGTAHSRWKQCATGWPNPPSGSATEARRPRNSIAGWTPSRRQAVPLWAQRR